MLLPKRAANRGLLKYIAFTRKIACSALENTQKLYYN